MPSRLRTVTRGTGQGVCRLTATTCAGDAFEAICAGTFARPAVHGARRLRAQQEAARRKRGSRPALDDDGLGFTSEFHPLDERLQRLGHDLLTRGAETIRTRRAGLALTNAAYALDAKIDRPVLESVRLGPFSHHHGRIDPSPIEQTASGLRSFEHRGRKRRMPPGRD